MKKIVLLVSSLALLINCSPDEPKNNDLTAKTPPVYVPPVVTPPNTATPCDTLKLKFQSDIKIGVQFSGDNTIGQTAFIDKLTAEIDRSSIYTSMYDILKYNTNTKTVTYDFAKLDQEIAFSQGKKLDIHGHVLIYPLNFPDGTPQNFISPIEMINFPNATQADKDEFKNIILNYVKATVEHCKGKVKSWDVTNEVFNNAASQNPNNTAGVDRTTWLRKRFPLTNAGDIEYFDFIADCFKAAHEADPTAILFYNDYKQEEIALKGQNIVDFINYIKNTKGAPISGYGLQVHTFLSVNNAGYESAFTLAASTGLQIQVSELDVSINISGSLQSEPAKAELDGLYAQQRTKYKEVAAAFKSKIPVAQQYGITMWDSTDAYTWFIPGQRAYEAPTMFDRNNVRKPAYFGFLEGLTGKSFGDCPK
jgi:endo-1,4-beta-xylanase